MPIFSDSSFYRKTWLILNGLLAAALLWALTGGVWDPLASLMRLSSKAFGGLFILLLLAFLASASFRSQVNEKSQFKNSPFSLEWFDYHFLVSVFLWLSFMAVYKHNSLQSHTFEMAIFNNVTWNAAHGNGFLDTVLHLKSYMGDHWQPVLWIFTPFLRVWESSAVFILAQAGAIVIGAAGLMKLALRLSLKKEWVYLLLLLFLLHPDLHKIHRFDFHPETLGFAVLIWTLYFLERSRMGWTYLLLFLSLFLKEDFPIYTFAIGLILLFNRKKRLHGGVICLASVAAFFAISFYFMPAALDHEVHTHMDRYSHLGANGKEMVLSVLTRPHIIFKEVMANPLIWETALRYLAPLLFLPLFNLPLGIATLAAWAPHAISRYPPQQTLQCQYGVAILVFLVVGTVYALKKILSRPELPLAKFLIKIGPAPLVLILLINFCYGVPRYAKPYSEKRIKTFHRLRKLIPPAAAVSAQQDLGPHVSFRKHFYLFPDFKGAEYVILDRGGNTNPFTSQESYLELLEKFLALPTYDILHEEDGIILVKRNIDGPLTKEEWDVLPVDMLFDHGIYKDSSSFGVSLKKERGSGAGFGRPGIEAQN